MINHPTIRLVKGNQTQPETGMPTSDYTGTINMRMIHSFLCGNCDWHWRQPSPIVSACPRCHKIGTAIPGQVMRETAARV